MSIIVNFDLTSYELNGREVTQFAMGLTNQNAILYAAKVEADNESTDDPCDIVKTCYHPVSLTIHT